MDDSKIINILSDYKSQAKLARESGPNARDPIWRQNWDLYWGRFDFSKKAPWQSKTVMPEAAQAIDRWSAAMREALVQETEWYEPKIPGDRNNDLTPHIRKFMDYLLSQCGRSPEGHTLDFSAVFEEQMKLGCLMMTNLVVTWKGHVSVESSDPRFCWYDPKRRGLYRVRRFEMDRYQLLELASLEDNQGSPLYDREVINRLVSQTDEEIRAEQERSSGHDQGADRHTIIVDEWLCTLMDDEGKAEHNQELVMVANDKWIIRGPETNPFWHKKDWIVSCPMIHVPFSVYGKSYMEEWSSVAIAFTEMTNLILDATFTSAMKAFVAQPDMLEDPTELAEGISPNKIFQLAEGMPVQDFLRDIDLGTMPSESVAIWTALKQEMREGQKLSELALGQLPPKGGITATEVAEASQSSSAVIRSMAKTIEERLLEPALNLIFMTGIQHVDFTRKDVVHAIGEDAANMLASQREAFRNGDIHFRVRGLSGIIERQSKLRSFLAMLQTIGSNEMLLQQFVEKYDIGKAFDKLMRLFGVDTTELSLTERERMMRQITQQPIEEGAPARRLNGADVTGDLNAI